MIEDLLAEKGIIPDIDDDRLGAAYDSCPAVHKSVLKNAVAFAYALAQDGMEPVAETMRFGHVEREVSWERLDWVLFAVDLRRFPVTAVVSAMVQALVAKVETLVVHVRGPLPDIFLFGCDFLSVDQIFTGDPAALLRVLAEVGPGRVIDLAGLDLEYPGVVRPLPADYGVRVELPDSEFVQAYHAVTAETLPQPRPYIVYGGEPGAAPVVMAERFLGCWIWDVISPRTFRRATSYFS